MADRSQAQPRVTLPEGRKWFTTAEAAALLDVTADAVRKAVRERRLEAVDLNAGTGRKPRYRVPARALRDYAEGR